MAVAVYLVHILILVYLGETDMRIKASDIARRHLGKAMEQARESRLARLPGLRNLALSAGVSTGTMRRVVAEAEREGLLTVVARSGIVVGRVDTRAAPPAPPERRTRHAEIRERLLHDILRGAFAREGRLPPTKALAGQYGVNYRTLRKALQQLLDDCILERDGRRLRVCLGAPTAAAPTVLLIGRGDTDGRFRFPSPRTMQNLSHLEHECERAGVRLATVACDPVHQVLTSQSGESLDRLLDPGRADNVLGIIVWTMALEAGMLRPLLPRLARTGMPVAVFDDGGPPLPDIRHTSQLGLFTVPVGRAAGAAMGRHLLSTGHRRAAYLCATSDTVYRERYEGLRDTMHAAGATAEYVSVPPHIDSPQEYRGVQIENLLNTVRAPAAEQQLLDTFTGMLRADLEDIRISLRKHIARKTYGPVLRQAMQRTDATAWVASNDDLAIAALDALADAGVDVPGRVSVLGFDDSPPALVRGLTSYNFDSAAAMHGLLSFVLRPGFPFGKPVGRGPFRYRFRGFVIGRRTSAKV